MRSARWWWIRAAVCAIKGHVPDGVVRRGNDEGGGGVMWCARRCGPQIPRPGIIRWTRGNDA